MSDTTSDADRLAQEAQRIRKFLRELAMTELCDDAIKEHECEGDSGPYCGRHHPVAIDDGVQQARELVSSFEFILSALQQAQARPEIETPAFGSEVLCDSCAHVFCPHGENLHFHHDGCPACEDAASPRERGEWQPQASVTRFEVINEGGRVYVINRADSLVLSYQDEGRTLKVFVNRPAPPAPSAEGRTE